MSFGPMPPGMPPGMPPMGGGPPGMGGPPMGPMAGGEIPQPSAGMIAPPPTPESNPNDQLQPTAWEELLMVLRMIAQAGGEDAARDLLKMVPREQLAQLVDALDHDPEAVAFLYSILPEDPHPQYPRNFTPPSKPKKSEIIELVGMDEQRWRPVSERMGFDLNLYHMLYHGKTEMFDPQADQEYYGSGMSDEVRAIAGMVATANVHYKHCHHRPETREDAQRIEDALIYWDTLEEQRYAASTGGDFRNDAALYLLVQGYIVWRVGLDFENEEMPFRSALLDPATVFPTWDDTGLVRVTRRYTDTIGNIANDYDPDGEVGLLRKLLKGKKAKVKDPERVGAMSECEVTVYHDKWWYAVLVDDDLIHGPVAHELGFVPYVIQGSGIGEPMGLSTTIFTEEPAYGVQAIGTRRDRTDRLVYKNTSYFWFRWRQHAQREVMMSVLYTLLQKANHPAYHLEQDDFMDDEDPEIDDRPGKITKTHLQHERLSPMISQVDQRIWSAVFNAINEDSATNRLPLSFFGQAQSANESGNALEGLYEAGRDKMGLVIRAMQSFYSQRAQMRLMMFRDWGHLIENRDGQFGMSEIPHSASRQRLYSMPSMFYLQPEMIRRAGLRVEADIVHLRMQNLGPLGNAVGMWMQANAMSAREAMEMRGVVDPDAVFRERSYEIAMMDPLLEKAKLLRDLEREDRDLYERYMREVERQQSQQAGPPPGMPPGMPPSQPGMPPQPGMPGGPNIPNTSAMDLSAIGLGAQGPTGRPPGPVPQNIPSTVIPPGA